MKAKTPDRPWYREPLVWLLIALPLAGVVMGTITATMAYQGPDEELTVTTPPLSKTSWREHPTP